jgi:hypothetical protein
MSHDHPKQGLAMPAADAVIVLCLLAHTFVNLLLKISVLEMHLISNKFIS